MNNSSIKHISTPTIDTKDYVTSLARGLQIMECFTDRQKLSVTQAATSTGISRTAARRHLKTLEHLGYLDSDGYFFWLTHKVLRASGAYLTHSPLSKIASPLLNALTEKTGYNYSIGVLDEHEVVTIACSYLPSSKKHRVLPYGIRNGSRLPAHTASNGKILLAAMSEIDFDLWAQNTQLTRFTPYTITDLEQFKEHLKEIRQQGWCIANQEHEIGFIALAIPVRNASGQVIAALNAVNYSSELTPEQIKRQNQSLMSETAREIRSFL